jgi:RNA polymerase sigma-70 factor, ECF subfamily
MVSMLICSMVSEWVQVGSEMNEQAEASSDASSTLSPETYESLRRLAAQYLKGERADHTLQPTALLHEALLRVLKQPDSRWRDEAHIAAFAARAMRRILISYGVARRRLKRGGGSVTRLPLDAALNFCSERDLNLEGVDRALEELETVDARQAQIVELRFFAGLTIEEIASVLQLSPATVKRNWTTAKLWLRAYLTSSE